jgi:hypothetical protein
VGLLSAGQETSVVMKPKVSPPFDYVQTTSINVSNIRFHTVMGSKFFCPYQLKISVPLLMNLFMLHMEPM